MDMIAPCALLCETCQAFGRGIVCQTARTLRAHLVGMDGFCALNRPDMSEKYAAFAEVLDDLCAGPCDGCRGGGNNVCSIAGCFIPACTAQHDVAYCTDCPEFPCARTRDLFEPVVYDGWLKNNARIRAIGPAAYRQEQAVRSHYEAYAPPTGET